MPTKDKAIKTESRSVVAGDKRGASGEGLTVNNT